MVIVSLFPSSDFLYRFKPCVVKNVSVDYASGSSPSFFKGTKATTSITLSIQLQEIEYWTNNDFTANAFSDVNAIQAAFRVGNNPGAVVAPTTRAQAPTEP
jgi:hypothetical protein